MSFFASALRAEYKLSGAKKSFTLPEEEILKVIEKQNRSRGVFTPTDRKACYEMIDVNGFPALSCGRPMSDEPQHPKDGSVKLSDVHFSYDGETEVIKGVSMDIRSGQTVALVGPSGGGKTTVSRLAARFWDHQQGSITVGGMDISKVDPEKLMGLYSIVFQDVTLFDNSILENIRLGRKDALYAQNGIYTHMVQFQTGSQNWAI